MPVTFKSGRGGPRTGAGRKSGWRHRETTLIRVPVAIAEEVVRVAHELDERRFLETETKSNESESQLQLALDQVVSLTGEALARRLSVDGSTVRKFRINKSREKFAIWSRGKDPDGAAWAFNEHTKRYEFIDELVT